MALLGAGGDTCCAGTRAGRGRTDDRGLGIRILMQYPHTQPSPVYVSAYSARQGMRIRRLPKPKYPKVSMYPCITRVARLRPLLLLGARARRGCARRARRQAAPAASPRATPSPRVASSACASSWCRNPRRPLLRRLPTSLQIA